MSSEGPTSQEDSFVSSQDPLSVIWAQLKILVMICSVKHHGCVDLLEKPSVTSAAMFCPHCSFQISMELPGPTPDAPSRDGSNRDG